MSIDVNADVPRIVAPALPAVTNVPNCTANGVTAATKSVVPRVREPPLTVTLGFWLTDTVVKPRVRKSGYLLPPRT